MALINCTECDREVSSKAISCPNCGAPVAEPAYTPPPEAPKKEQGRYGCLTGISIALVLLAIFAVTNDNTGGSSFNTDGPTADAEKVCISMRNTGFVVSCEVNTYGRRIHAAIDTTPVEAVKICSGTREQVKRHTTSIRMWKLIIISPTDASNILAECYL